MSSLVSVVIPVYKVEKYLRNCIESVINQSYTNWEMILVDDGSPDRSGKICDEYAQVDARIHVIHQQNRGQANARNNGVNCCRGDYVTFLDSDDFFHPQFLEYMLSLMIKENADIVQCSYLRGSDTCFHEILGNWHEGVFDNHSIFLKEKANVIVWGKIIKREIVEKIRITEGRYYEDDFTTWKWYYNSKCVVVSDRALYYYTINPQSTMAHHIRKPSLDFFYAYNERILFFEQTEEKDLEHCSRLQFCKALVLTYNNNHLSKNERLKIKVHFQESWKELKKSPYIELKYKVLFGLFQVIPQFASYMAEKLRTKV